MRVGLSYDLKNAVVPQAEAAIDALEEYDSVETIDIIKRALENAGHIVYALGGGTEFLTNVLRQQVDIVFNIAEGRGSFRSREAQVPGMLEMLGIPYTGSDPQTLAICLDKALTKKLVSLEGVKTPGWALFHQETDIIAGQLEGFSYPAIVKPSWEGSSKGIHATSLVNTCAEAHEEIASQLCTYHQPVMIEEFVTGDEVTVGILGNRDPEIIGTMRILPRIPTVQFVYSLEVKRDWERLVSYESPADITGDAMALIKEYSIKAYQVLGCRDFSRVDFRVSRDGTPYFLEINPLPGLGTYSDLIIMALQLGWSHEGVITSVLNAALERHPQLVCA